MSKYKIVIERPICIACENCVSTCPEFWEMADDGFSHLKGSTPVGDNEEREMDDLKCNQEAADICPVNCIHIYEDGNQII